MSVIKLRRFLSLILAATLSISHVVAEPDDIQPHDGISAEQTEALSREEQELNAAYEQIIAKVEALEKAIDPAHMDALGLLMQKYGPQLEVAFIEAELLEEQLKQAGMTDKLEQALAKRQEIVDALASTGVSHDQAKEYLKAMHALQMLYFQKQLFAMAHAQQSQAQPRQQLPPVLQNPGSEQPQSEQPAELSEEDKLDLTKQQILELINDMGPLKNVLCCDPEIDIDFERIRTEYNSKAKQPLSREQLIAFRTRKLDELQQLGVSTAQVAAFVHKSKYSFIKKAFGFAPQEQRDLVIKDPENDADFFEELSKKASAFEQRDVSVESILKQRTHILEVLRSHGISHEEAVIFIGEVAAQQKATNFTNLGAAASASILFGISDYFLEVVRTDPQIPGSLWNSILGTVGYYKELAPAATISKSLLPNRLLDLLPFSDFFKDLFSYRKTITPAQSEWVWSKPGRYGRALQILGMLPAAYLYKHQTLLPSLKQMKAQGQLPPSLFKKIAHNKWMNLAALGIPWVFDQHENVTQIAFQQSLGQANGKAAHFAFSRALPLLAYATYFYHKNKDQIAGWGGVLKSLGMHDNRNALSHAGLAALPVAEAVAAKPINQALLKLAPTGRSTKFHHTFLRSLLNNDWGFHLARIATDSIRSGLVYKQHRDPNNAWFKADFGTPKTTRPIPLRSPTATANTNYLASLTQDAKNELKNATSAEERTIILQNPDSYSEGPTDNTAFEYHVPPAYMSPRAFRQITEKATIESADAFCKISDTIDGNPTTVNIQGTVNKRILYNADQDGAPLTSATDAAFTHAKGALAQLATKELVVAGGTSGLWAANKHVAKFGKKVGAGLAWIAKKAGMSDETRAEWEAGISSMQHLAKMAVCMIWMVADTTTNPKAMIHNPQQLTEMIEGLTEKNENLDAYLERSQVFAHNTFATLIYNTVLKDLIAKQMRKHTSFGHLFTTENRDTNSSTFVTALKATALAAAWLASVTTFSESIKPEFDEAKYTKSFEADETPATESQEQAVPSAA